MSEIPERPIKFDDEATIPSDELAKMKAAREDIKITLGKYKLDSEGAISIFLNLIETAINRIYATNTQRYQYELMKKCCNDYINSKMLLAESMMPGSLDYQPKYDPRKLFEVIAHYIESRPNLPKNPHTFKMHCTLCGRNEVIEPNNTAAVPNPKITRIETEGCPSCWKGKGELITNVAYFDKDNKLLLSLNHKELMINEAEISKRIMEL